MKTRVVGLGAGGHAKVVIEILRQNSEIELVGLLDASPASQGTAVAGVPVLGPDEMLPDLAKQGIRHFFVGLAGARNTAPRRRIYDFAAGHGLEPVDAIHPRAIVSESAQIGRGVTIMAGAIINAEAVLGLNVIVNTGSIVEHDCRIGDHVHIAPGARLTGGVRVDDMAHVGAGAVVRQMVRIGSGAVVGAGAVVIRDVKPNSVVAGVPARELDPAEASTV